MIQKCLSTSTKSLGQYLDIIFKYPRVHHQKGICKLTSCHVSDMALHVIKLSMRDVLTCILSKSPPI